MVGIEEAGDAAHVLRALRLAVGPRGLAHIVRFALSKRARLPGLRPLRRAILGEGGQRLVHERRGIGRHAREACEIAQEMRRQERAAERAVIAARARQGATIGKRAIARIELSASTDS